jgi:hypothetical protein
MQKELISFNTAKLAKEKGFKPERNWNPEYVPMWVEDDHSNIPREGEYKEEDWDVEGYYLRPTQTELQRWLREDHDIHIYVEPCRYKQNRVYGATVASDKIQEDGEHFWDSVAEDYFPIYEQALEDGLLYALTLIS